MEITFFGPGGPARGRARTSARADGTMDTPPADVVLAQPQSVTQWRVIDRPLPDAAARERDFSAARPRVSA